MTRHIAFIVVVLISATAFASDPYDRCEADKVQADRELAKASNRFFSCGAANAAACNLARALLATAIERKRTVEAACTVVDDRKLAGRLAKLKKLKERKLPKRRVVLKPTVESDPFALPVDPFEIEPLPPAPYVVPVPGVPWLVDPVVERECPGLLCPIVVVIPPGARRNP